MIPTAVHQSPVQNREYEISKPDQDSVDGDQPDSGIEDLTKQVWYNSTTLIYFNHLIRLLCSVDTTKEKDVENVIPTQYLNMKVHANLRMLYFGMNS